MKRQCKKLLVYTIIFTQIYSPAAYGGKLYFEIEDGKGKVVPKINLKIWEEEEVWEEDSSTHAKLKKEIKKEIYNNIIEFTKSSSSQRPTCKLPQYQPLFPMPEYGLSHKYFERSLGIDLQINHYNTAKSEEINFTIAYNGDVEIQHLLSPHQVVFIKTFGDVAINKVGPKLQVMRTDRFSFNALKPRELALYLKGDFLYCKTKEKLEKEVIQVNASCDLGVSLDVLDRLKEAARQGIDPSLEDQKALFKFTGFCNYTPTSLSAQALYLTGRNITSHSPVKTTEELSFTAFNDLLNRNHIEGASLSIDVSHRFENAQNAHAFATKECTLKGTGCLFNEQNAEIISKGTFVSYLPEVENYGDIVADLLINFKSPLNNLTNCNLILSHGELSIDASSMIVNHKILESRHGSTQLKAHEILNDGSLNSLNGPLFLNVCKGENNSSIVSRGVGGINLIVNECFINNYDSELKSEEKIVIKGNGWIQNNFCLASSQEINIQTDFENKGKIEAGTDIISKEEGKTFVNTESGALFAKRNIKFRDARLFNHGRLKSINKINLQTDFENHGKLKAGTDIVSETEKKTFHNTSHGEIVANRDVTLSNTESLLNQGLIQGQQAFVKTSGAFTNEKAIVATIGTATFHHKTGKNSGVLKGEEKVTLTIEEQFENEGNILSPQTINAQGRGCLLNKETGLFRADRHLSLSELSIINEGLFESLSQLLATLPKLVQKGDIKSPHASFNINDFQNFRNLLIEDDFKLIVYKGHNEGQIQGNNFALIVLNDFINKSTIHRNNPNIHAGQSFTLEGVGAFANQHNVRVEGLLTLKNKTFLNLGHIESAGNIGIEEGTSFTNSVGAKFLSRGQIRSAETASVTNKGLFRTEQTLTLGQPSFENEGRVEAQGDIHLPNCHTLQNAGQCLILSEQGTISLPRIQHFLNDGLFHAQGNIALANLLSFCNLGTLHSKSILSILSLGNLTNSHDLLADLDIQIGSTNTFSNLGNILSARGMIVHAPSIINHGKMQGSQGITLTASQSLENRKGATVNSDHGNVRIDSPHLTITGPIKGQNVAIHSTHSPFSGSVEAVQTLTLHVPQGLSLEHQSRAFGHSLVLHGPIRNPSHLNIKGDFVWHNPEGLSNSFNMIIGGKLHFIFAGPWVNGGLCEGQKGANITTPSFKNNRVFNACEGTHFNCTNGFENYAYFRMNGVGSIHVPSGSIINGLNAQFHQFGHSSPLTFTAAQDAKNTGGTVFIEGKLTSNSRMFSNEVGPNGASTTGTRTNTFRKGRYKHNPVIRPTTREKPGAPAYFHANQAYVHAHTLLNHGGALSSAERFEFNGDRVDNLTRNYMESGSDLIRRKRHKYRDVPFTQVVERRIATLKSQGILKLVVNGQVYDRSNLASLNGNKKKRLVRQRRRNNQPTDTHICGITNTGEIQADVLCLDLGSHGANRINFSEVNSNKTVIPPLVRPNFDDVLNRPGPWTLDNKNKTAFKIIPQIFIPVPADEDISTQLVAANEGRKKDEAEHPSFIEWIKTELTEQFNREWEATHTNVRGRYRKTLARKKTEQAEKEAALNKFLEARGALSLTWEPNTDELAPITSESLLQPAPRIAVVENPQHRGGERMLAHPALLAEQVTKAYMQNFGCASLSRHIYNPLVFARVLEDEGYLNARRAHGLPPLPSPENWTKLSPKEQLACQLREMVSITAVEGFQAPAIIYELANFHNEFVLSPIFTFPKHIREAFKTIMGKKTFGNYFSMKAKGDVKIVELPVRKGADIETEKSLEVNNQRSQGEIVEKAKTITFHGTTESGSLTAKAEESLKSFGASLNAKQDLDLDSGGTLDLGAQEIVSQTTSGKKKNRYATTTVRHQKAQLNAGRNINAHSKDTMTLRGIDTKSGGSTHFKSGKNIKVQDVHDYTEHTHTKKKKKFWGGRSQKVTQETFQDLVYNSFSAGTTLDFEAEDDIDFDPADVTSKDGTTLISHEGAVSLKADKSIKEKSTQGKKNSVVWQKQQSKGRVDETVEMTRVKKGEFTVKAKKGVVVETPKDVSLETLAKKSEYAWLKNLQDHPNATWRKIETEHKKWNHKAQGLTSAGAALLSLGIGIATAGTGSAIAAIVGNHVAATLGSAAAGQVAGTMASGMFSTLASQSGIVLVNNKGNIGKTLKDLGSKEKLKALRTSIISAGVTAGVMNQLGISPQDTSFNMRTMKTAVQTGVSGSLAVATGDQSIEEAFIQGLRGVLASTVQAAMCNKIGEAYSQHEIDDLTHKVSHAIAGGLAGAILSKDPAKGAASGATGAFVAELVATALPETIEIEDRADMGRVAAAVTATVTGQDVNIANNTSMTAVENNFLNPASTFEGEQERLEMSQAAVEGIGEILATEIPILVDFQQTAERQATTQFEQAHQALQDPNLSWLGRMGLYNQQTAALENMGNAQMMPTTVGDMTLEVVGFVSGTTSQASNALKKTAKLMKPFAKIANQEKNLVKPAKKIVNQMAEGAHAESIPIHRTKATDEQGRRMRQLKDKQKADQQGGLGFKGRKGVELKNAPYQKSRNTSTVINGQEFSGHALDQMQNRGFMPSVVQNAIREGSIFSTREGTIGYYDSINKIKVITNSETGKIITVIFGENL